MALPGHLLALADEFHFHRGPDYAAEFLRYDRAALAELPDESTASFAGVANPQRMGPFGEGAHVVDIGCGAGMDLMLAAKSVGPRGRAIGVDMTEAMADKARAFARAGGLDNIEVRLGDAMAKPFWAFKPEAEYVPMDVAKAIDSFVKKLERDHKETGRDHTSMVAKLLALRPEGDDTAERTANNATAAKGAKAPKEAPALAQVHGE